MNVVELCDAPEQAWRNGGGITRELLAWPADAPWQLRVSVAEIIKDGNFSAFPGVQRWFSVLEGAGVELCFAHSRQLLGVTSAPCSFDGATAPACRLLGGATRDLNLMVRHDAGQGSMARLVTGAAWHSAAPWRAVFTTGTLSLNTGRGAALALPSGCLAWNGAAAGQIWHADGDDSPAWWLSFQRHLR